MILLGGIRNALREVWGHKLRSALTLSGITLGVAALVGMVGMIESLLEGVRRQAANSGSVRKFEVDNADLPAEQRHLRDLAPGLTWRDVEAIHRSCPLLADINARTNVSWSVLHGPRGETWGFASGLTPGFFSLYDVPLLEGRRIGDLDVERAAPVCLIAARLAAELFGPGEPAVGRTMTVRGRAFRVIGVMAWPEDDNPILGSRRNFVGWLRYGGVAMPITTAHKRFTGDQRLSDLEVQAVSLAALPDAVTQVENALLAVRRGLRDFEIETQVELYQGYADTERRIRLGLGGIAGLSLLVGGIGIFSVMLASVNERVREIGVRKALGARRRDVFLQFLVESGTLAALGGAAGLAAGYALLVLLRDLLPDQPPALVPWAFTLGFAFSAGVGFVAGLFPAVRAARLDPIEALRHE